MTDITIHRLTREEHLALAPIINALRHGLMRLPINNYPKNSRAAYWIRKTTDEVDHLRCKLDSEWFRINPAIDTPIIYYGDRVSGDHLTACPVGIAAAEWLYEELLVKQIIKRLEGHRPVALIDAALKVDRRFPYLIVALQDTPLRKRIPIRMRADHPTYR